jgi:hypothetical protein
MYALLMTLVLTNAPIIRIDMRDALRFSSGAETPPGEPLVIYVKAPASWVSKGAITEAGKKAVLARLYGGPNWMNGNGDGSTYVVKEFSSKVLESASQATDGKGTFWYEVKPDGTLDKRGPSFGEPLALKMPGSLIDEAEKDSVFKMGPKTSDPKLLEWLGKQKGLVKLPVTLKRGQVGFTGRGATVGKHEIRVSDTELGISLADRARQSCQDAATCELLLVGHWKGNELAVTKVEGKDLPGELAGHAWVNEPK